MFSKPNLHVQDPYLQHAPWSNGTWIAVVHKNWDSMGKNLLTVYYSRVLKASPFRWLPEAKKFRMLGIYRYNEECLKCFIFVFFSSYNYLVYHNVLIYDRISYNLMYYMWVLLVNYDFCLDLMNGIN